MAHVDKKHFGKGTSGKGSGSGSMIDLERDMLGENEVLSNREKKQQPDERGQDDADVKTDQYQDQAANRRGGLEH